MLRIFLWIQAFVQVLSVVTLAPPQNIHVNNWQLTWTHDSEKEDVTYTVQYRSFDTSVWKDVQACVQTFSTSCNVTSTKAESEHGCVMLRVLAERQGLTSKPVKACSRHGDSCTPEVSLTARPGSLTVFLSRNHSMVLEHGDHVKHRVYYGKEGQSLQKYKDAVYSLSIPGLEEGQRYCTRVQYMLYEKPFGPESCTQCEVIPESEYERRQTVIITAMVVVVVVLILIPAIAYILIFQHGRIKKCLHPPCKIPDNFLLEPFSEHHILSSPSEEHYDIITAME
ncbi:interferon gamma receptor 2 isoform X1 [Lates calcarifer]|uniref:Interferon gamma receptor 2 isoform X1 n=1 Tax=Lates calcarifer TaxID=8187 RepID=A0AAJ7QC19_LATCA|nr:interferon gamma receptor 2 isoform X1 [Lates calcarifer]